MAETPHRQYKYDRSDLYSRSRAESGGDEVKDGAET